MCTVEVVLLLSSVVKITEAVTFLSFCDNLAVNWKNTHFYCFGPIFAYILPLLGREVLLCTVSEGAWPYRWIKG